VFPGSVLRAIGGFGAYEGDGRWIESAAVAGMATPKQSTIVRIRGVSMPVEKGEPRLRISMNGRPLGEVSTVGEFDESFLVPADAFGPGSWADMLLRVDSTDGHGARAAKDAARDSRRVLIRRLDARPAGDLPLPPGGRIDLGARAARRYFGSGWSLDEAWGETTVVWATGRQATLLASLPGVDSRIEVRMWPFSHPRALPQRADCRVNGVLVGGVDLPANAWTVASFPVPAGALSPGVNVVRFEFSRAVSPASVERGNGDRRPLAVAFDFVKIEPATAPGASAAATGRSPDAS
jgi:hypothetical protein